MGIKVKTDSHFLQILTFPRLNRMPTEQKMTTCDCCLTEMDITELTDHHGEWLCSKCEEELEVNEEDDDE